jgi:hypothetical protein
MIFRLDMNINMYGWREQTTIKVTSISEEMDVPLDWSWEMPGPSFGPTQIKFRLVRIH